MQPIQEREYINEAGKRVVMDMFTYQVPVFTNLAVGASLTNQIIIQADADFEWIEAVYEFDLAAAAYLYNTRPMPNMTVLIVDGSSGRQLMNNAVPVVNIFGRPEMPYVMPITKTFKANATIQFTATNFDAAVTTGNLRLSLIGVKHFIMG